MIGIDTDVSYNDLQNNYMGIALQDKAHPSLPLISVAIFCILAKRLGVDARCCVIPQHVHAVVYPSSYETLDGRKSEDRESEPMYLDPFRSDDEVSVAGIREILAAWGIPSVDFAWSTLNSTTAALVLRTSRSILTSVQIFTRNGGNAENAGHPTVQLYANPYADMDNAFYSALWARFMMSNSFARFEISNQRDVILLILEKFERLYPMDASLIEQYICPLFNNPSNTEHWDLHEALRVVRAADQSPRQLRLRDTSAVREKVKYKVGQIFRHKRYAYTAVITGWDIECGMNSDWMAHNNVDSLAQGRYQSFYHAL
jgi:F-box protein 21